MHGHILCTCCLVLSTLSFIYHKDTTVTVRFPFNRTFCFKVSHLIHVCKQQWKISSLKFASNITCHCMWGAWPGSVAPPTIRWMTGTQAGCLKKKKGKKEWMLCVMSPVSLAQYLWKGKQHSDKAAWSQTYGALHTGSNGVSRGHATYAQLKFTRPTLDSFAHRKRWQVTCHHV